MMSNRLDESNPTMRGLERLEIGAIGKVLKVAITAAASTNKNGISRFAKTLGSRK